MSIEKKCQKCGSKMVPMSSGKGWRCGKPGNRWMNGSWTLCDYSEFNKTKFVAKQVIERASTSPKISNPTKEQKAIRDFLALSPQARGGRCLIIDAGPGTAKTTTISWSLEAVYNRLGNLNNFPICAFNVNARNVLQSKLPTQVPDIFTLNGWGAQAQGYRYPQYDAKKTSKIFRELVSDIPYDKRPKFGMIGKVLERARDLCLYANGADSQEWQSIFSAVLDRFPSMEKKIKGQENTISLYLPLVASVAVKQAGKIDIQEQVTRPVTLAQEKIGWKMPTNLTGTTANDWTDSDVAHFAKLIRAIEVPPVKGIIVDEAQDLSLAQIAVVLASAWKTGELVLIGDDVKGTPGMEGYKAGQAIYGWRGAFGGSLQLISRLWTELTGEKAKNLALTGTFRHTETICAAYRNLNTVIRSAKKGKEGQAYQVSVDTAFSAWLEVPENETALFITRTNAALADWFMTTLENHADATIRGGGDFTTQVDVALFDYAGWYDDDGEYKVKLADCLSAIRAENAEELDPNSIELFILRVGEVLLKDSSLLRKAQITDGALSVGNLRRFIAFFADKNSRRVCTTVYRCKGDEADLVIVGDSSKFNESWGNTVEDNACRHVALSRAKKTLLTIGHIVGSSVPLQAD